MHLTFNLRLLQTLYRLPQKYLSQHKFTTMTKTLKFSRNNIVREHISNVHSFALFLILDFLLVAIASQIFTYLRVLLEWKKENSIIECSSSLHYLRQ